MANFQSRLISFLLLPVTFLALVSCERSGPATPPGGAPSLTAADPSQAATPVYSVEVVRTYPHATDAFTEGLFFLNGEIYESTGLYERSSLRRVDLLTGKIQQRFNLTPNYFGEGLAAFGDKLYQLTWKEHTAFVYDLKTFKPERQFQYTGEGWGLATDGKSLLLSDGTDQIRFLDPATFTTTRSIHVTDRGTSVANVNELEYVKGEIYANIWKTTSLASIDPATGKVLYWVDCRGLLSPSDLSENLDVFNGIAYDSQGDRLFVTGKYWPKLFEVKIRKR